MLPEIVKAEREFREQIKREPDNTEALALLLLQEAHDVGVSKNWSDRSVWLLHQHYICACIKDVDWSP